MNVSYNEAKNLIILSRSFFAYIVQNILTQWLQIEPNISAESIIYILCSWITKTLRSPEHIEMNDILNNLKINMQITFLELYTFLS